MKNTYFKMFLVLKEVKRVLAGKTDVCNFI